MAEDRTYDEVLGDIAGGTRHTADQWPEWFADESGNFEDRVRKVFETYGIMPTPAQFTDAQSNPLPRASKKKDEVKADDEE